MSKECHDKTTGEYDGPPGAGKTTYVKKSMSYGDIIVDMDAFYYAVSGLDWYKKPECLLPFVCEARYTIINRLSKPSNKNSAWVIRSGAKKKEREKLQEELGAQVIVIEKSLHECINPISKDEFRSNFEVWEKLLRRWWEEYEKSEGDVVVSSGISIDVY